jgi:serine/threonine-protein kinase HipA
MQLKKITVNAKDTKNDALSLAYDMVVVSLVLSKDPEELALNLNAKKRKLKRQDFNEKYKFSLNILIKKSTTLGVG